jgi:hypothetical protein
MHATTGRMKRRASEKVQREKRGGWVAAADIYFVFVCSFIHFFCHLDSAVIFRISLQRSKANKKKTFRLKMKSFLPKFIAKRIGNSKSKYEQVTHSYDSPTDEGLIDVIAFMGGGLCAVSHQDAVCALVAEYLGGVKVFVECDGTSTLSAAIEEALGTEARELVSSPTATDDVRSVATLRGGGSTTESSNELARRLVVLYLPLLTSAHGGAVLDAVASLPQIHMRAIGCLVFDGSGATIGEMSDVLRWKEKWSRSLAISGGSLPVLSIAMGCTVFDTYELARAAVSMMESAMPSCAVSMPVGSPPSAQPPRPGASDDELMTMEEVVGNRSASYHRLKMCRTSAVTALRTIAQNLLSSSDVERYRVLATSSERFQSTLGSSPNAMRVLHNMGFRVTDRTAGASRTASFHRAWSGGGEDFAASGLGTEPARLVIPVDTATGACVELRRLVSDLDAELARRSRGK